MTFLVHYLKHNVFKQMFDCKSVTRVQGTKRSCELLHIKQDVLIIGHANLKALLDQAFIGNFVG